MKGVSFPHWAEGKYASTYALQLPRPKSPAPQCTTEYWYICSAWHSCRSRNVFSPFIVGEGETQRLQNLSHRTNTRRNAGCQNMIGHLTSILSYSQSQRHKAELSSYLVIPILRSCYFVMEKSQLRKPSHKSSQQRLCTQPLAVILSLSGCSS